jgi:GNAT superfamily N-acetyltransferase
LRALAKQSSTLLACFPTHAAASARHAPDAIPIAVIGRLAVSRNHAGIGLGTDLLADALRRIATASRTIGIAAVLVQAKNDAARRFYLRCAEFTEYPAESCTLFLTIETVIVAFS